MKTSLLLIITTVLVLNACSPKYTGNFQNTEEHYERLSTKYSDEIAKLSYYEISEADNDGASDKSRLSNNPNEILTANNEIIREEPSLNAIIAQQKFKSQKRLDALAASEGLTSGKELSKRQVKKALKDNMKKELRLMKKEGDEAYPVMLVLGILLAPLAIALTYGIDTEFWISLVLLLLFWLPSAIYGAIKITQYYK